MWRTFKRAGDVRDVYPARKRLVNGKRFGFVRFSKTESDSVIEKRLNNI